MRRAIIDFASANLCLVRVSRNRRGGGGCDLVGFGSRCKLVMDSHTLELLDFEKVRILVAARAACSLGKTAALRMEPSLDPSEIHSGRH